MEQATSTREAVAVAIPPSAEIQDVSITEQGDAALSVDGLNGVRLWPSLDGKQPAVKVEAGSVRLLALGHAGADLFAAIVDEAGFAQIVRLSRTGAVRSRAPIPGELTISHVAAIDSGVLIVREDQSIERFDLAGNSLGRVTPEAGERILGVAVRHGNAIAAISDGCASCAAGETKTLRWLVLGDGVRTGLHWGTPIALPTEIAGDTLALAPGHHRIAGASDGGVPRIFDLDPPRAVASDNANGIPVGFSDDDHLALVVGGGTHRREIQGGMLQWWAAAPVHSGTETAANDPWAIPAPSGPTRSVAFTSLRGGSGVADGIVAFSARGSIGLFSPHGTKYLGWAELAGNDVQVAGNRVASVGANQRVLWSDSNLVAVGQLSEAASSGTYRTLVIGPHHVIKYGPGSNGNYRMTLFDAEKSTETKAFTIDIGEFSSVNTFEYSPRMHVFTVVGSGVVDRSELDLAADRVTKLPPIKVPSDTTNAWPTDPSQADGVELLTLREDEEDGEVLIAYKATGKPKHPFAAHRIRHAGGSPVAVLPDATEFERSGGGETEKMTIARLGKPITSFTVGPFGSISLRSDASAFAIVSNGAVGVRGVDGHERWKRSIFGARSVGFSEDDHTLFVAAPGGIVALDADTGAIRATACGWRFGLLDSEPTTSPPETPSVCEAPQL